MTTGKIELKGLWKRFSPAFLASTWAVGMTLGAVVAISSRQFLVPMVEDGVAKEPFLSGLLCSAFLPFLLSVFAVSFNEPWLLLIISMFKAFSFSFCATGVSLAYAQSSWLVRLLFLFSDILIIPILYVYWLRHISDRYKVRRWELPLFLCIAGLVVWIDFQFIAPFLTSLICKV